MLAWKHVIQNKGLIATIHEYGDAIHDPESL